jgi:AcrR family transcriptional regulator
VAAPTLRADAARNLELILEAAEAAFAEKGHEAGVADIAARAGVGQATIFRRFETKDDLIAAVFERKLGQLVEAAEAAGRKKRAWDGLTALMVTVTELQLRDRGFFQSIAEQMMERKHLVELKLRVKGAITALVDRAKAEGDLREDISPEDVFAFCCAAAQAATIGPNANQRAAKRYLSVMMDGMRAKAT